MDVMLLEKFFFFVVNFISMVVVYLFGVKVVFLIFVVKNEWMWNLSSIGDCVCFGWLVDVF